MLNLIGWLTKPTSGNVQINLDNQTRDITKLKEKDLKKLRLETIGYILQDFKLLEDFKVKENLEILLDIANEKLSNNQIKEILAGVIRACNNGCVRAQQCREHQKDSQINVSDGIDKVRGYLFTINGKHKTKVPFCNE